jgi:hypothetical protein
MRLPSPILKAPMILAPAPTTTLSPRVGWRFLPLEARAAECHALEQGDVLPDLGGLADDDAHAVVDEEAGPELGRGMDLDAGEEPGDVRQEARGDLPAAPPDRVGEPMAHERVDTRIAEEHLERGARGGVPFTHRLDVAPELRQHPSASLRPGATAHAAPTGIACRSFLTSGSTHATT